MGESVQRQAIRRSAPDAVISVEPRTVQTTQRMRSFLGMFLETLDELANNNYFTKMVGSECVDDHPCGWSAAAIQEKLARYGCNLRWPLSNEELNEVSDRETRSYVEFFFQIVSAPLDEWVHSYCGSNHPNGYDDGKGRYHYIKRINDLLKRHHPELRFDAGRLMATGSRVFAPILADPIPYSGDSHLESLVEGGIRRFQTGNSKERERALTDMANALERVKTSLDRQDKRRAVQLLAKAMSPNDAMLEQFDGLLRSITNLSNGLAIRHHEHDRTPVSDNTDLVEFMFYSYYNLIRYALKQTNKLSGST